MAQFVTSAGAKLSYATIVGGQVGTYNDLKACKSIPEIGQAPNEIDSTNLDNTQYTSSVQGLINVGTLEFPFNLESPSVTSNINIVAGLNENTVYSWKITYPSGCTVVFKSRPRYRFNAIGVDELESFTLSLSPEDGLTRTIPTASI